MAETRGSSDELSDRELTEAIRIRQEYQSVKSRYEMYRYIRRLMGKTKKSVMDFQELRDNALSLTGEGYK